MNKKALIGIGVVILLIGGVVYFINPFSKESLTDTSPQGEDSSSIQNITGTMKDLIARGKSLECTFSRTDSGYTSSGTVYLSGKKMRGNFVITQGQGEPIESSVIRDGGYVYTWTSLQTQGTKMKIVETEDGDKAQDDKVDQDPLMIDNEDVDYSCKPWRANNSKFVLPSNVEFRDISQQVQKVQDATERPGGIDCSVCELAPEGSSRDQCKLSLGCE